MGKKVKEKKSFVYFLKNKEDGSFWDGGYSYEISQRWSKNHKNKDLMAGFRDRPRFFKTPAALFQSLRKIPRQWVDQYEKDFPVVYDEKPDWNGQKRASWQYYQDKRAAWEKYISDNKLSSLDILKMFAYQNWFLFQLEEGKATRSAKKL